MSMMNRLANCHNRYQGTFKRVLCVCSAGLLRSPTTAYVLAAEFDCNTRAAGLSQEYALIPVDRVLIEWADEIVCMEADHAQQLKRWNVPPTKIIVLNIPDEFEYRDPELVRLIRTNYAKATEALATPTEA